MVSDGAGGAIIAWDDIRNNIDTNIYAQRINSAGVPLWTADGVLMCSAVDNQFLFDICADGGGGAIVTWTDDRGGAINRDIYARRIGSTGVPQWTANGVAVCSATGIQFHPALISDGGGGAIVTWEDPRNSIDSNIFAQRINVSGTVLWLANGVSICGAAGEQTFPVLTTDGAAGAILSWWDSRNGNFDTFAQRVNSAGAVQWVANGVSVYVGPGSQVYQAITTDGAGGAILVWSDSRFGNTDIYGQRLGPTGTLLWNTGGEGICYATGDQYYPVIASDGSGGALVAWVDLRNFGTNHYDTYAQRITGSASTYWRDGGVPLCTAANEQTVRAIVSDGAGGGVFVWEDLRTGSSDVYAQRVTAPGIVQWSYDGMALCATPGDSYGPRAIADGPGGALVAWYDSRNGASDVYAQRVEPRYGFWGKPEPALTAAKDNPRDQGGKVILNWTASGRDNIYEQTITNYSIWRGMDVAPAPSSNVTVIDRPVTKSARPGERVVWRESAALVDYYWELVGSQIANYTPAYSFTAPTRQDSTAGNIANQYFRIVAEGYSQFYNWPSNALVAHSVDNLAPSVPLALTAQRVGNWVHLKWNGVHVSDLRDYSVYRKTSAGVTPIPVNFLASADDTVLTDTSPPPSSAYYIVTAYDVHANQSAPSNEAAVAPATGTGNLPPITALSVLQNHPNPFSDETDFNIGLPARDDLSIEVYDVAGRRVRAETLAQQSAGWQRVRFDGRDRDGRALASGVYFYRVHANGSTITRKFVIAR